MAGSAAFTLVDKHLTDALGDRTLLHRSDRACELHRYMHALHLPGGDLVYVCFDEESLLLIEIDTGSGFTRIQRSTVFSQARETRLLEYLREQGLR